MTHEATNQPTGDIMTTTELELHRGGTLALSSEQTYWTGAQLAALQHIGVEKASDGDLMVFHHVCQRTGLDPFARQIYMIGREVSEYINNDWVKVTKQTIQTGIDGFRLIGRRAADRAGHRISVGAPEWAHSDGTWRPVWMGDWGYPVAARVIVRREGESFEAVALFDEYKQTKRNGDLTRMWAQRPAGQIAKCAEALAWRMAFPQDLSGIYADDEMGQADNYQPQHEPHVAGGGLAAALQTSGPALGGDAPTKPTVASATQRESAGPEPLTKRTRGHLFALFAQKGVPEEQQLAGANHILGTAYTSRSEFTEPDALRLIEHLDARPDAPVDGEIVLDGAEA